MNRYDVHVCLVSAQPTPNFIPVLAEKFRPKKVILVVTPSIKDKANALAKVMHNRCKVEVQQIDIKNEYDTADISDKLLNFLADVDKEKVALNVTGGTKLMAIGAYFTFRKEGCTSFYVYEKTGEIKILDTDQKPFSVGNPKIQIEDYLELHGFSVVGSKRPINEAWFPVAQKLIQKRNKLSGVLRALNGAISTAKENNPEITKVQLKRLDKNMADLINILKTNNLVSREDNNIISFKSIEARDYVAGGWFEEYVFNLIEHLPNIQDCALGVEIDLADKQQRRHNELDVVFMANNTLHVVECKTANFNKVNNNDDRNKPLYLLKTLKETGGNRTKTAFISYHALGKKCDPMKARADGLDIKVLEQKDLDNLENLLKNWINPERKS